MRRQTITRDRGPGGPEEMPAPGGWPFGKTSTEVWYWLLTETRSKTFKRQRDRFTSEAKIDALARVLANALGMSSCYWVEEAKSVVAEKGTLPDQGEEAVTDPTTKELWSMLDRNWEAWNGEEDSVKEEHQELIDDLEALLDRAPTEEGKT